MLASKNSNASNSANARIAETAQTDRIEELDIQVLYGLPRFQHLGLHFPEDVGALSLSVESSQRPVEIIVKEMIGKDHQQRLWPTIQAILLKCRFVNRSRQRLQRRHHEVSTATFLSPNFVV